MAALLLLAQLLLLGTLLVPAQAQTQKCDQLVNATAGNFSVGVRPEVYQPNTPYTVTVNSTDNKTNAQYFLQALTPQNESLGQWMGVTTENCTSVNTAIIDATQNEANWTSPDRNVSSVEIRVFIVLANKTTQFKTKMLNTAPEPSRAPATTPNSVPSIRSSSFFLAVLQLPLLLATSKLLS